MKKKNLVKGNNCNINLMAIRSNAISAASVELELPIQAALDKINASKDSVLKSKVLGLTSALFTSQEQIKSWDLKIIEINSINDEALAQLQQKIKEIDAV